MQAIKSIKNALKLIGVHTQVQPASPETFEDAREMLNDMVVEWQDKGIEIDFTPAEAINDELSAPAGTMTAIEYNLAVRMAPIMQVQVPPVVYDKAEVFFRQMERAWSNYEVPEKVRKSTTPVGQGNQRGPYARSFSG